MRHLGIKSKIRIQKRFPKKKEIKDTKNIGVNYIKRNFKCNSSRTKLFTDTSQWNLSNGMKLYFSAVIDASKGLLGLDVSTRNDSKLVNRNITRCIKKVGRKFSYSLIMRHFIKTKQWEE